jgi:hypothetical protein
MSEQKESAMNKASMLRLGLLAIAGIMMAGCASTSEQKAASAPKGDAPVVFDQSIATTQQAAVNALAVIGCDIKKQEPTYVEGHRPNKIGLVVGSGGETVKVWLDAAAPEKTSVKVQTKKSLVGLAGQKNWDKQVLDEMTKSLAK